jgi:hypothetical protein
MEGSWKAAPRVLIGGGFTIRTILEAEVSQALHAGDLAVCNPRTGSLALSAALCNFKFKFMSEAAIGRRIGAYFSCKCAPLDMLCSCSYFNKFASFDGSCKDLDDHGDLLATFCTLVSRCADNLKFVVAGFSHPSAGYN